MDELNPTQPVPPVEPTPEAPIDVQVPAQEGAAEISPEAPLV